MLDIQNDVQSVGRLWILDSRPDRYISREGKNGSELRADEEASGFGRDWNMALVSVAITGAILNTLPVWIGTYWVDISTGHEQTFVTV